jgi:hypothetical protein
MSEMGDPRIEGEPDPKPFKLRRVDGDGNFISLVEQFATREEADAYKRRLDWRYELWIGRRKAG